MDSDDLSKIRFERKENSDIKHLQLLQKYCGEESLESPCGQGPFIKVVTIALIFASLAVFISVYQPQAYISVTSYPIVNLALYAVSLFSFCFLFLFFGF